MSTFIDPFAPARRAGGAPATPQPPAGQPRDPERMTKAELVGWADELGLSTAGTRADLVARILAAV